MAQNADSLLKYMDNLMSAPLDIQATVKIILAGKSGSVKEREAMMKQKGKYKKLYRYTKPESQAGIATLSLPNNVMWLYLPAFGTPTKISILAKSQTFTGTDFSYEDMENRPYSERYKPVLLKTNNSQYYALELTPKLQKTTYSRIVIYMSKSYYYPVKMEFYNKKGTHIKKATYKYKKQGKYWWAEELIMTDLIKQHYTKILLTNVKFDQGLTDDEFRVEVLKQ
ncbi:outer membrane lipoprotein-sorting protein [candidate division KSB1 bacterium]